MWQVWIFQKRTRNHPIKTKEKKLGEVLGQKRMVKWDFSWILLYRKNMGKMGFGYVMLTDFTRYEHGLDMPGATGVSMNTASHDVTGGLKAQRHCHFLALPGSLQ